MKMFPMSEVYIQYACPVCDRPFTASLAELLVVGIPFCPEDVEHGEAVTNSDFVEIEEDNEEMLDNKMIEKLNPRYLTIGQKHSLDSPAQEMCKCGKNPASEPHECPLYEELYDDHESLCTCCPDCVCECLMDI